ncbi:YcaO-like family protein [Streptomyces sp. Rer75]|uniref:YcaO-like family protein n=1 Tax=Streptomyces sp. Rer75 TaxID=2750011 RepID=UPI00211DCCB0|nr:YcaO-like family protein [Streptomyces sp. Rer75]
MLDIPRTLHPSTGVAERYSLQSPQGAGLLWSSAVALHPVPGVPTGEVPPSALIAGARGHSRADVLIRGAGEAVERRALHPLPGLVSYRGTIDSLTLPALDASAHALAAPHANATVLTWYPARCLRNDTAILVPASLVNWPAIEEEGLFDPSPSGAAAGTTADAALRSALVEIVERDAFTTAWARQLRLPSWPHPEQALGYAPAGPLRSLWQRALGQAISPVIARIPTAVPGLCCVVVVLLDPPGPNAMAAVGMKASGRPEQAILGALQEAWQVRAALDETSRTDAPTPEVVVSEHDRIRYLLSPRAYRSVADWAKGFMPGHVVMRSTDVTLRHLTDAVLADGADPLVVDLTPRLSTHIRGMGWRAVKVIPAGYQGLRMDERHVWTWNLRRVDSAPQRTGCAAGNNDHRAAGPHPLP